MSSRNRFRSFFTKLPSRSKMTFSIIALAGLSHLLGSRASKRLKDANFRSNMNILSTNETDWSCFYLAKQYHEECDDINRGRGLEYMEGLCKSLEDKLGKCRDDLYRDISALDPYSMDPPAKLVDPPPWLESNRINKTG